MSVRVTQCSGCSSTRLTLVEKLEPDPENPPGNPFKTKSNIRARFQCENCGKQDEYLTMSAAAKRRRQEGYVW